METGQGIRGPGHLSSRLCGLDKAFASISLIVKTAVGKDQGSNSNGGFVETKEGSAEAARYACPGQGERQAGGAPDVGWGSFGGKMLKDSRAVLLTA